MPSDAIYTVSDLTRSIRKRLESSYPIVWVKGQIANLSQPSSGHIYFSLKDEYASINAVWFKGNQSNKEHFDPLTGEVYEDGPKESMAEKLENGQEIICAGRLSVYEQRGVYQIIVEIVQEAGIGRLHAEFERLKKKLGKLGYFDSDRKRPLPENPTKIALITAPTGAAIHDFIKIAKNRGLGAEIRLYPSLMQGTKAHETIIHQMDIINKEAWADLLVIIRGGGSLEDLQAFNNEELATAILNSKLPVLAGIGHEVDISLADMTADCRAATPSHAAQIMWKDRKEYFYAINRLKKQLKNLNTHFFHEQQKGIQVLSRIVTANSPYERLGNRETKLSALTEKLNKNIEMQISGKQKNILRHKHQLDILPYSLRDKFSYADKVFRNLNYSGERFLSALELNLTKLSLSLDNVDPLKPLKRGYALVYQEDNRLLKKVKDAPAGSKLRILIEDGEVFALVEDK